MLELARIRKRWRYQGVIKSATVLSAEAPEFGNWFGTKQARSPPPKPQGPRRVRAPFNDHEGFPRVAESVLDPSRWRRVVAGVWKHKNQAHNQEYCSALRRLRRVCRPPYYRGKVVVSLEDIVWPRQEGRALRRCVERSVPMSVCISFGH